MIFPHTTLTLSGQRFRVDYRLVAEDEAAATAIARGIALEQTVEVPGSLLADDDIRGYLVGRIEVLEDPMPDKVYDGPLAVLAGVLGAAGSFIVAVGLDWPSNPAVVLSVLASSMVGVIALALSALSVARDFELGTIRVLLVLQPDRIRFLAGKLAALAVVIVAAVTAAAVIAGVTGLALSGSADIDTSAWSASATLSTYANLTIGALIWGLFGAAIAVVARSASTAITAGVAYFLVGENLLRLVWDDAGDWLPAGLLDTFTSGGSADVAYLAAAALLAIYVVAATTTLSTVFVRRDITD